MYTNIKNRGVEDQRRTYNSKGDAVIGAYENESNKDGATPVSVKEAMLAKAKEIGFISAHSSLGYEHYNAIDLSYKDLTPEQYKKLRSEAEKSPYISFVVGKEENDPALHIEIPTMTTEDENFLNQGYDLIKQAQQGKISPNELYYKLDQLLNGNENK